MIATAWLILYKLVPPQIIKTPVEVDVALCRIWDLGHGINVGSKRSFHGRYLLQVQRLIHIQYLFEKRLYFVFAVFYLQQSLFLQVELLIEELLHFLSILSHLFADQILRRIQQAGNRHLSFWAFDLSQACKLNHLDQLVGFLALQVMFEEVEDAGNCFKAVLMIAKVVMVVHNIALGTHTLHFSPKRLLAALRISFRPLMAA